MAGTFKVNFAEQWKKRAKLAAQFAVGIMANKAKEFCAELLSEDDHSLQDLARMGHPYAVRRPANPHDPPETVHQQTGALLAGLTATPPRGNAQGVTAKVFNREKELDGWIQRGTSKMIARPYMRRVQATRAAEIIAAGRAEFEKRMKQQGASKSA